MQLSELKDVSNIVHLQYEKSILMATYMLCGFRILPQLEYKLVESVL